MSEEQKTTRRTVLRSIAGGAAAVTVTGAATEPVRAAALPQPTEPDLVVESGRLDEVTGSSCTCETEYKCDSPACGSYDETVYKRECCTCDNGTVCDDWQITSQCCLS